MSFNYLSQNFGTDYDYQARLLLDGEGVMKNNPYPAEWRNYIQTRQAVYRRIDQENYNRIMRSEANWMLRSRYSSGLEIGIHVVPGDICWMDFGQMFNREMGYQHFGLVIGMMEEKAIVVPVTSSETAHAKAENRNVKVQNVIFIGQPVGLTKPSSVYINDIRTINTARIMKIRAHLDVNSEVFLKIKDSVIGILNSSTMS